MSLDSIIVLSAALTKLHPGSGRSPGVVDLPVVRDALGYYFVPGTMLKGSIRSHLKRTSNVDDNVLSCLFGSDVDEKGTEKLPGVLSFHDLYPLFVPAPSSSMGVVYVTSPLLLSRAYELSKYSLGEKDVMVSFLKSLIYVRSESEKDAVLITYSKDGEQTPVSSVENIMIGGSIVEAEKKEISIGSDKDINSTFNGLHVLYDTLSFNGRIVVLREEIAINVLESLLMRITRVRLDRETKTVSHGALWTEEYIPWGTLLLGSITRNSLSNEKCQGISDPIEKLLDSQLLGKSTSVVLGGKETVGGGVVRIKLTRGSKDGGNKP